MIEHQPQEAEKQPTPSVVATPLRCAGCVYDLSGLANGRCPECGRPFGDADRAAHARFAAWQEALPRVQRKLTVRATSVIAIASLAFGAFYEMEAGLFVAITLAAHVIFAVLLGLACALLTPRWERPAVVSIWLHHLWWVHLPWLTVPVGVGFVWVLGTLLGGLGPDAGLVVSLMLLQPWIALVIMSLIGFPSVLNADVERAGIRRRSLSVAFILGTLGCVGGSVAIGLIGGAWLVTEVLRGLA